MTKWIYRNKEKLELFIASEENISEEYVVLSTTRNFKKEALDWWLSIKTAQKKFNCWATFVREVKSKFVSENYRSYVMDAFEKRKKTGSADQSTKKYCQIALILLDLFERRIWDKFVNG